MRKLLIFVLLVCWALPAYAQTTRSNPDSIPFAPPVAYGTGSGPFVFCADLDDDQDLDMAVTNQSDDYISIFLNDGDGTFQTQVDYEASPGPVTLFCADLDGDLDLDVAVSHIYHLHMGESPYVSIFLNNGDGTYQAPTNYVAEDSNRFIFCDDVDGDSDLDLAVVFKHSHGGSNIAIFLNNGDGTFEAPVLYPTAYDPSAVFCADLNGDTYSDLAVTHWLGVLTIFFNNGDGTFQAETPFESIISCTSVFSADLDGDFDLDLAVTSSPGTVSILLNDGEGSFQDWAAYPAGTFPRYVTGGDLDGDSDLDLAVAHASPGISILANNGDGTFQSAVRYDAGGKPDLSLGADSEADLRFDAVSINGDRANALYHLEGTVFCADLDGDLDLDIAATGQGGGLVSIFMNLTQVPGNSPPYPFPLLSPADGDTTSSVIDFDWAAAYDPNLSDQIRYDLFVSTSNVFPPESTTIDSNLAVSHQTDTLPVGTYYWKVKAQDNWGAETWSTETLSFTVTDYIPHIIHVPGDYDTIQHAIDAAYDGDTVLVAPDHYYERINFRGKAILVASNFIFDHDTATISSTIIDADTTVLGVSDTGSVVRFVSGEDTNSVLTGFAIQNGTGTPFYYAWLREGGGIYCLQSSPTISHNIITRNNTEGRGGGIWCWESRARIVSNIIRNNSAFKAGGGICDTSNSSASSSSYIAGNIISENEIKSDVDASGGAGIACLISSPTICGNTIVRNTSPPSGGGILCNVAAPAVIVNNIVAANNNYGIYCRSWYGATPAISYNDLWNNTAGNIYGGPPGVGDTTWGVNLNETPCDSFYNIIQDPLFADPDSDFRLQPASPCIDAGDNNAQGLPEVDLDGNPRIADGNQDDTAIVDMGAFEFQPSGLPVLSWTDNPGYVTDGVSPDTGLEGTLFTFRVVYSDSNNLPPQSGYTKVNIDLNGDGDFEDENEGSFTMGVADVDTNYVDGREYLYNATLPVSSNCRYSFSAKNSYGLDAVGEPTNLRQGPVILDPAGELDLYIHASDITFSNQNPDEGETFTVYATIHNNSDSNLTNVSVTFYHSEELLDQVLLSSVPSNGSATASTELSFDTKGFYPIRVVVDEENSFQEWNELNNFAMRPTIVGDYTFPGGIVVEAGLNSPVYPHSWITVTGNAHYTPEYLGVVSGGTVTITLQETGAEYTTYTNDPGNFSIGFYGPTEPGNYSVIVEVTDYTLTDSTSLNLDVVPPQSGVDLTIRISMSQTSCLLENQEYTVEAEIFNLGDQDAQDFWACIYKDGSVYQYHWMDQLAAGHSFQIDTVISFSSIGRHTVTGIVDVGDSVIEYNEGNNVDVVSAYVACDDHDITITNVVFSDYTPKGDQPIDITAWVQNWGAVAVGETFGVEFSDNGIPFDTQYVTSLAPCGTQTAFVVSENFVYSDTMSHSFSIFADFENAIAECNEENNIYWAAFSVFPDLWPRNLEFSQDCFTWGDSLWFQVDIYNIGEETAESVWVSFLLDEVPIGEDVLIDSIPSGSGNYETRLSEEPWIVPEQLDVTHVCRVVVDPYHEILEIREDNNELTRATPVVPCGDVNGDCIVNVGDVVFIINYLFKGGPDPYPYPAADVNADQTVDVGDVVYLINYLYRNGPAPECQTVLVSPSEKRPIRVQ